MAEQTYTLYDIPTKEPATCWSPNTWKARAILNIKNVPYTTEWVEYPDIRALIQGFGLPPGPDESMPYTLPLLRIDTKGIDAKPQFIGESDDIVKYINDKYPSPPVDLTDPINQRFTSLKTPTRAPFAALVMTSVPDYLPERSAKYFHETREPRFGGPLADFRKKRIHEGAWDEMEAWVSEVRELLRKNGGPFFLGEKLSGLDIRFAGLLKWVEITGHKEDYEKLVKLGGQEFKKFWDAAQPWLKRQTY